MPDTGRPVGFYGAHRRSGSWRSEVLLVVTMVIGLAIVLAAVIWSADEEAKCVNGASRVTLIAATEMTTDAVIFIDTATLVMREQPDAAKVARFQAMLRAGSPAPPISIMSRPCLQQRTAMAGVRWAPSPLSRPPRGASACPRQGSVAVMSAEVEIEIVFCGGNASPDDTHLAADVVGIDDEILEVLAARERRVGAKQVLSLTDFPASLRND